MLGLCLFARRLPLCDTTFVQFVFDTKLRDSQHSHRWLLHFGGIVQTRAKIVPFICIQLCSGRERETIMNSLFLYNTMWTYANKFIGFQESLAHLYKTRFDQFRWRKTAENRVQFRGHRTHRHWLTYERARARTKPTVARHAIFCCEVLSFWMGFLGNYRTSISVYTVVWVLFMIKLDCVYVDPWLILASSFLLQKNRKLLSKIHSTLSFGHNGHENHAREVCLRCTSGS